MKKVFLIFGVLALCGCAASSSWNEARPAGDEVCVKYQNGFLCNVPTRTYYMQWFPKNMATQNRWQGTYYRGY